MTPSPLLCVLFIRTPPREEFRALRRLLVRTCALYASASLRNDFARSSLCFRLSGRVRDGVDDVVLHAAHGLAGLTDLGLPRFTDAVVRLVVLLFFSVGSFAVVRVGVGGGPALRFGLNIRERNEEPLRSRFARRIVTTLCVASV